MLTPRSRVLRVLVAATAAAVGLAGCGGAGSKRPGDDRSVLSTFPTTIPSQSPYLEVPAEVHLTPPGKGLSLGLPANVAWVPRQDEVGVLRLRVKQIEVSTVAELLPDFNLTGKQRKSTPYLVRARATNIGERSLGGRKLPLYLATTDGTLVEASEVDDDFTPCRRGALPSEFPQGASTDLCELYLLPEGLTPLSISFVPTVDVDPVYWQGAVDMYGDKPPSKGGTKGKHGKGKKGSKGKKSEDSDDGDDGDDGDAPS